ncbi:hypothetical protein DM02DRAFT_258212 [Periconia macrospinosa]|uniref:Uncharacterized protein n=1 Tax=Periconia macrospinosa TaxID=97972 RepID=A0A2V1DYE9_9PLEO|nr:hypothetical protein DM02DRAFT_258212 [Periconia macrospinosa]
MSRNTSHLGRGADTQCNVGTCRLDAGKRSPPLPHAERHRFLFAWTVTPQERDTMLLACVLACVPIYLCVFLSVCCCVYSASVNGNPNKSASICPPHVKCKFHDLVSHGAAHDRFFSW